MVRKYLEIEIPNKYAFILTGLFYPSGVIGQLQLVLRTRNDVLKILYNTYEIFRNAWNETNHEPK